MYVRHFVRHLKVEFVWKGKRGEEDEREMEIQPRFRERNKLVKLAINEATNGGCEVRNKEMADLDFLVTERNKAFGSSNSVHRESNEGMRVSIDLFGGRSGGLKNPSNQDRETSRVGDSDVVRERVKESGTDGNGVREGKRKEVENPAGLSGKERRRETPPDDDCCPICFGEFNVPCQTSCGHWFCADCFLTYWNYSNMLKRCKCPICSRLVNKFTPEASLTLKQEGEVVDTLKKVQSYNCLFVGGAHGIVMKVIQLPPLLFKGFFQGLMDPNRLRFNYYTARIIACFLAIFYETCGFDFVPSGSLGIRRVFEFSAIALVIILSLVGLFRRHILGRRMRFFAAHQQ